ncbi:MAG: erythromycin esterase family protein [Acidobacteria bacterium]|nr:erythromycin esterase family protein [Acidobacteriota bacterium]
MSDVEQAGMLDEIRSVARPLSRPADLDALVARAGATALVCIGEASHGTHDFYSWRAALSKRLIEEEGFSWIGVEGDWPDCWRLNRWVKGLSDVDLTAHHVLAGFSRWPTWMWANEEVAEFLDWLREYNRGRSMERRVGFYGLDVYSLWDSLREIMAWLNVNEPAAVPAAMQAWRCFAPYGEDPQRYAWSTRMVPENCETDVVTLLVEVRRRAATRGVDDEAAFDAWQNAEVAAGAENYYRTMVRGDRESWNIRDRHMVDTIERINTHLGPAARGLIWEHNTHVGDARATDMVSAGLLNVGQLLRERHGANEVTLIGMATRRGTVIAARAWGEPEQVMVVPEAMAGSHEDLMHRALGVDAVLDFATRRSGSWFATPFGHRAIGVVYDPRRESGNYVATIMGTRYDALLWFEETTALGPLHHEGPPSEPEFETAPSGY